MIHFFVLIRYPLCVSVVRAAMCRKEKHKIGTNTANNLFQGYLFVIEKQIVRYLLLIGNFSHIIV